MPGCGWWVAVMLVVAQAVATALPTDIPILKPPVDADMGEGAMDDLDAIVVDAEGTTTPASETNASQPKDFLPSDCFLPKVKGPCRAILEQVFFNTATKTCEVFGWSGCGGNKNRFPNKDACELHCTQPIPVPTPIVVNGITARDSSVNETLPLPPSQLTPVILITTKHMLPSCPKFAGCGAKCVIIQDRSDGGCKKCLCGEGEPNEQDDVIGGVVVSGSTNGTVSKSTDVSIGSVSGVPKEGEEDGPIAGNPEENCKLPTKRGHCRGMMTRYHYDPAKKDCVEFHYGGCDGNLNNFVSKAKCLEYCKGQ